MQERIENLIEGPLKSYLEGNTSVSADERTNQLILVTHPGNLNIIMNVIASLDVDAAPLTGSEVFQLRQAKAEEVVPIIEDIISGQKEGREEVIQTWVKNIHWQMDSDRKTTALKSLQGRIWNSGYEDGTLKGQVYEDVPGALRAWQKAEIPVYIYSSGSIAAQKLLFGGSTQGDLRPFLSGYFDTTTGPKREATSYAAIAETIEVQAKELIFVTDVYEEAEAAAKSGVVPVLSIRPGNKELPEHPFRVIESLDALL